VRVSWSNVSMTSVRLEKLVEASNGGLFLTTVSRNALLRKLNLQNALLHLGHLQGSRLANNHVSRLHVQLVRLLHAAVVRFFGDDKEKLDVVSKACLDKFLRRKHLTSNKALRVAGTSTIQRGAVDARRKVRRDGVHVGVEQKTRGLAVTPSGIHVVPAHHEHESQL
jgi:hypothetical protein